MEQYPKMKINFLFGVGIESADIVDLETAKLIKKLGFQKPTYWYFLEADIPFVEKGLKRLKYRRKNRLNHNKFEGFYSAPTKEEFEHWINSKEK